MAQDPSPGWQAPESGRAEGLRGQCCSILELTHTSEKRGSGANHNNLFVFWHQRRQTSTGGLKASDGLRFVQGECGARGQRERLGSIAQSRTRAENDICNTLA